MIEWRSAAEWAEMSLPGIPSTKSALIRRAASNSWQRRQRKGKGGGFEYHYSSLPDAARNAYILRNSGAPKSAPVQPDQDEAWATYERLTHKLRDEAERRLDALYKVENLTANGVGKLKAVEIVASEIDTNPATIRRWLSMVKNVERRNWLPALAPRYTGNTEKAECHPAAWDWYVGHYLTRAQPTHAETYRRLEEVAAAEGWSIPSARTLVRRVETEIDGFVVTLQREGVEAAARLFPKQQRDETVFAAGEAVNGDGLKFDRLWVRFPDGEIINTATAWLYQDIRTRKILAWRLGKTENTDLFRLATYDLTEVCAPKLVIIDNTRVAANKLMTAGAAGRHRFKDQDHDGLGLLLALGMRPQFTNPDKVTGNPGSKPIERAFGKGGIHEKVATNPALVGKGFSKATAIDVEELRAVLAQEVERHNAQTKRRTRACRGVLSFDEAWAEATQSVVFRKFSERQRRMLLMVREVVRVDETGMVSIKAGRSTFGRNRYWSEESARMAGKRIVAHFDPDNLHAGVHAYSKGGDYLFAADYVPGVAFDNTNDARELHKFRQQKMKALKKAAEASSRMSALDRAALYAKTQKTPPDAPDADQANGEVIAAHFARPTDPARDASAAARAIPAEAAPIVPFSNMAIRRNPDELLDDDDEQSGFMSKVLAGMRARTTKSSGG